MAEQRIKGQETAIIILKDGELQARIDSIKDCEVTFELEILEEDYLGDKSSRYDAIYKGMTIRISGHMTNRQVVDLSTSIVGRAQRRAGGAIRIDMSMVLVFPGGDLVTIAVPDVQFQSIPINNSNRTEYVEFTLEAKGSDFDIF